MNLQRRTTQNSAATHDRRIANRRRGAMAILIAFMMICFLVTVAFSVDVAYMQLSRTELRTATDAAARAGSEALSRQLTIDEARQAAIDAASRNNVLGDPLLLDDADIEFGMSSPQETGMWVFQLGETPTNAVRVTGRRTEGSPSGPVNLLFGALLGRSHFEPVQEVVASQLDRDICIVLDRSGSMAWDLSGVDWSYPPGGSYCEAPHSTLSRWAAADAAVDVFLAEIELTRQVEQVSCVTYANAGTWCDNSYNAADLEVELTSNYTTVANAVNSVGSQAIPGGTNISAGIEKGIETLTNPDVARGYAVKTMILLTDGVHNAGSPHPEDLAVDAAAEDITIHTITFSNGANQQKMIDVANATGGNHYHAPDAQTLQDIFREIASTLPIVFTQ